MVGQLNITAFQPTNMQSLCSAYWGSNKCSFGDAVFRLCFPHLAASAIIRTKWHHQWLHYTAYCTAGWKQSCLQSAWHSIISSLWRSVNPLIAQILTISRAGTFSSSVLIVLVASRIFFFFLAELLLRLTGVRWIWSCCCCSDCSWNWPLLQCFEFYNTRRW